MKRKWLLLVSVLVVMIALGVSIWSHSKTGVISHVSRNAEKLERYAERCMETPENDGNYKGWSVSFSGHDGVVKFQVSYLGFGSQSDERGFYYASDGQPRTFGCDLGREQREQTILFLGEGDNYVLTEVIAPNWFWYEQHW